MKPYYSHAGIRFKGYEVTWKQAASGGTDWKSCVPNGPEWMRTKCGAR